MLLYSAIYSAVCEFGLWGWTYSKLLFHQICSEWDLVVEDIEELIFDERLDKEVHDYLNDSVKDFDH